MKLNNLSKAIIALVGCELAGIIGSVFTVSQIPTWYAGLMKPPLNPPGWIFGPVWTILYALMGIALYLVWKSNATQKDKQRALVIFGVQLFLNVIWSIIFFGLHSPAFALVDIMAMWCAIVATIIVFGKISRSAAYLLVPYLLWVTFAGYLNYVVWMLN
ncbi:MAG: TspO/MBR family protein [Patescibacteria group bacterium]